MLLPLADRAAFAATAARPSLADAEDSMPALDFGDLSAPTAPVDLDLTAPDVLRPVSQFALLEPFPPLGPANTRSG